jgi:hypothetical protein
MKKELRSDQILAIVDAAQGGRVSKATIVAKLGRYYYHNAAFHLGNVISRLIKTGKLERVAKGIYQRRQVDRRNRTENLRTEYGELWNDNRKEGE